LTKRDIKTISGFLFILIGIIGGIWVGWWLATEGDIIEIIHRAKLALPGWAWLALKVGLSATIGIILLIFCIFIAALIFREK